MGKELVVAHGGLALTSPGAAPEVVGPDGTAGSGGNRAADEGLAQFPKPHLSLACCLKRVHRGVRELGAVCFLARLGSPCSAMKRPLREARHLQWGPSCLPSGAFLPPWICLGSCPFLVKQVPGDRCPGGPSCVRETWACPASLGGSCPTPSSVSTY